MHTIHFDKSCLQDAIIYISFQIIAYAKRMYNTGQCSIMQFI